MYRERLISLLRNAWKSEFVQGPTIALTVFGVFFCFWLIGHHFLQAGRTKAINDAPKFKEVISAALECKNECLNKLLAAYPQHSLVVYSVDTGGDWIPSEGHESYSKSKYHYACPEKWLAVTKEKVKLVVIVSRGDRQAIGNYSHSGITAYSKTWNLAFVDLAQCCIVAKAEITKSDPQTLTNPFASDSWSIPDESEVVAAIQRAVKFAK